MFCSAHQQNAFKSCQILNPLRTHVHQSNTFESVVFSSICPPKQHIKDNVNGDGSEADVIILL